MKNAEFSGKPRNSSPLSGEDIPAALRDTPDIAPRRRLSLLVLGIGGLIVFTVLAVISGFLFAWTAPKKNPVSQPSPTNSTSATTQNNNTDQVLGHLVYTEAPESELAAISADGRQRMRKLAAQKYQEMVAAARSANVILTPISSFRSVKEQEQLFFQVGAQRNQTPAERAALSAPPGHSEHHTGYAVDIGDGAVPATNLNENFENTKAFQWLQTNAARFGFEMSFPKNNSQGVSYEPWHWRFVGDRDSLETFYKAKNIKPTQTPH
ncbi:MAG: D-alanyl-D-alanine carboxypeptidase family protein [Pelatocladus maniniholoensis HA4357-MV3]|uniref:D-alanyl-D-alanine carboxypeptidase family protein n=1 Tax=Pelatocladus maniniholoensis HA4357-MV3 TaxID=1117104 RepID=A0A9E3LTK5_9NOST|nr:D-alanyl-D-alanine carboxypeptidase family protein [Pelatocladus maniniholoensis HA4357-MV3]BAZ66915.1 peptidase M15B and M15C, D,D-carboxypeptidase VanY/endolysin [Fischerella sp. NIES-4106]